MNIGDTVLIDFPGHIRHGKSARVVMIEPELDLSAAGDGSWPAMMIFVDWPGQTEPVGIGPQHIGGTIENQRARREARSSVPGAQGELML